MHFGKLLRLSEVLHRSELRVRRTPQVTKSRRDRAVPHCCGRTGFLNVCVFTLTAIVVLFHMENGFRKDVRTADVDMEFCTASRMFSAMTVVSL